MYIKQKEIKERSPAILKSPILSFMVSLFLVSRNYQIISWNRDVFVIVNIMIHDRKIMRHITVKDVTTYSPDPDTLCDRV